VTKALLLLAAAALLGTAVAATFVSRAKRRDLAEEMVARIHALAPGYELRIASPLSARVMNGPQADTQINFNVVEQFCRRNDAAACEDLKQKFATAMAESISTANDDVKVEQLHVIVRSQDYVDGLPAAEEGKEPVSKPVATGVKLVLVRDLPNTIKMVQRDELAALHLTEEEAIALGTRQVLADLPPLPTAAELRKGPILISGEDYAGSYILATDEWRKLARSVDGFLWLAIPSDQRVMIGTATDADDLARARASVASDFEKAARGISPVLYRWTDDRWEPIP